MADKAAEAEAMELVERGFEKAGTVPKLAEAVGKSDRLVRYWRAGRIPGRESLARLREYVGASPEENRHAFVQLAGRHVTHTPDQQATHLRESNAIGPHDTGKVSHGQVISFGQVHPYFVTPDGVRHQVELTADQEGRLRELLTEIEREARHRRPAA